MFFWENLKLAISSLKTNKMRAFLTMLGIIIGISSVIAIMSLGEVGKASISKEFENIGTQRIAIYLKYSPDTTERDYITQDEFERIKTVFSEELEYLSPVAYSSAKVKKKQAVDNIYMYGVNEDYKTIGKMHLIKGRFVNHADLMARRDVAVIDKRLALKLFKRSDIIGETIKIEDTSLGKTFVIIGVYEVPPSLFDSMSSNFGDSGTTIYAPVSSIQYEDTYTTLEAQVADGQDIELVKDKIMRFLSKLKNRKDIYDVETAEQQLKVINNILGKISLVIGAIAAISLLVGGIGIMNIMLVSVTERTREIGIRKAIGATKKDILLQFLVEAMIISAAGGLLGTIFGLTFSGVVTLFLKIKPVITLTMIVIPVAFSAIVGVFFGLYPANKAAKLDPIEALRYE